MPVLLLLPAAANENDKAEKNVAFKNNAPFRSCISKINSTLIDSAEDLDIVMLMYNLLEYSQNYSMALGSLWNYRDKFDDPDDNASDGQYINIKQKNSRKNTAKTTTHDHPNHHQVQMELNHHNHHQQYEL